MSTPSTPDSPDSPRGDSLAAEVFDERTRAVPAPQPAPAAPPGTTTWAPTPGAASTTTAERPPAAPVGAAPPAREYVTGPAPFAVVLGLLGLVVAATTLFTEVVGIDVPWDDLGPWSVVGGGVLVLLVGALGLRSSRRQD